MTEPFGLWWTMNTPEERKEFADAMNQAVNDWSKLVVMPFAAAIVLSCVFIR